MVLGGDKTELPRLPHLSISNQVKEKTTTTSCRHNYNFGRANTASNEALTYPSGYSLPGKDISELAVEAETNKHEAEKE
jgi:hypothetical protein